MTLNGMALAKKNLRVAIIPLSCNATFEALDKGGGLLVDLELDVANTSSKSGHELRCCIQLEAFA